MTNNENRETKRNVYSMDGLSEDNQRAVQDVLISGYARYLENYDETKLSQGAVDVENYSTRHIGLWALARYEEDKKVRSGLVKFYGGLTTEAICNAVRDTFTKGDCLGFQAAVENLVLRGKNSLILKLVFELEETTLPLDVISAALLQTLRRENSRIWSNPMIWLVVNSLGKTKPIKIERLDSFVTVLSTYDIATMKEDALHAIVEAYECLDEGSSELKIRELTKSAIKDFGSKEYAHWVPIMDVYVREFFGIE